MITTMAWAFLLTAGALEVICTTVFRVTGGMTRLYPTMAFFALGLLSFYFLNKSLSGIPLGTAYAIWTGIGAAGTALVGIWFYQEPAGIWRMVFLFALIASIIGLKLVSAH